MNAQMLKGILEGCILNLIGMEETYGYKVVEDLNQYGFEVNEATVYPILKRLEKRDLLMVTKKPSPLGPMRKYFRLSLVGEEENKRFQETWSKTKDRVDMVLKGEQR
jgi:PadR family transcriptional regulator PadR